MGQGDWRMGVFCSGHQHVQRSGSERKCGFLEEQKVFQQASAAPGEKNGVASSGSNHEVLNTRQCVLVAQLCLTLCDPMDYSPQAPLSMGFSRQEYWSGLPFPSPGDLPNPWIEPGSRALQADSLPAEPPRKPYKAERFIMNVIGIAHPIECLVSPF